jgi:hypothetical protein
LPSARYKQVTPRAAAEHGQGKGSGAYAPLPFHPYHLMESGPAHQASHQRNDEESQEQEEQDLCYASRSSGNTAKSQHSRDNSDNEEDKSIVKHRHSPWFNLSELKRGKDNFVPAKGMASILVKIETIY